MEESDKKLDEAIVKEVVTAVTPQPTPGESFAEITETTIDGDILLKSPRISVIEGDSTQQPGKDHDQLEEDVFTRPENSGEIIEVPDITCSLCKAGHSEECTALEAAEPSSMNSSSHDPDTKSGQGTSTDVNNTQLESHHLVSDSSHLKPRKSHKRSNSFTERDLGVAISQEIRTDLSEGKDDSKGFE